MKQVNLIGMQCILKVANCTYPTPTLNETSQTCTCLPEDAKKGDYAKCEGDSCECVPVCQENMQCPGWNNTCNANSDNCNYCGGCGEGFGCCIGTTLTLTKCFCIKILQVVLTIPNVNFQHQTASKFSEETPL